MICPKCHTIFDLPSDLPANFCPNCGANLRNGGGRTLIVTAALVLAIIVGAYGYVKFQLYQGREDTRQGQMRASQNNTSDLRSANHQKKPTQTSQPSEQFPPVSKADLVLTDINGREILSYPVAILSPGWFAFPMRSCIGAYNWRIALASGRNIEVEGGILHDADPIGLWQLPVGAFEDVPELVPWIPEKPLTWYPYWGTAEPRRVQIRNVEILSDFARIPFEGDLEIPGVFVQNNHVVGWSFGALIAGGYLWTGNPGQDLISEFYINDFYRLTFAGGKEEAILLALSDDRLSDTQRLAALAEAHRLEPHLTPGELPEHIRPAKIQRIMQDLITRLSRQEGAEDLLTLFDTETVLAINDPTFSMDLIRVARDLGAYAYTLDLTEALQAAGANNPDQAQDLSLLQIALYREWLNRLIAAGDPFSTQDVYREASKRFPQDPVIYLIGVELALQEQDWPQAEKLLASRSYPYELRETVSRLQQKISDLKSQEGKIVILFRPGSRVIPVVARLDRSLNQRFVIDTGASLVTVPSLTARRLGIDISNNLPRRLFYSATGVQHAVEITLPYIALKGWVIENVRALVVDLPGQPEVGLLGMNYLSNFRMDINSSEGVLLLDPR